MPDRCPTCGQPVRRDDSQLERALRAVRDGATTAIELAEATGFDKNLAATLLSRLYLSGLVVRIGWKKHKGPGRRARVYALASLRPEDR